MIDLHAHILPGVDDGARDLDEALAMLRASERAGVRVVAATPHVLDTPTTPFLDSLDRAYRHLTKAAEDEGIALRILRGAEIYLNPDTPAVVADHPQLTLGGAGRHVLVELPMRDAPSWTEDVLYRLQLKGVTPILAHPERCSALVRNMDRVGDLEQRGVLLQLDACSLLGDFGRATRKAAKIILSKGWAWCVASDIHRVPGKDHPLTACRKRATRWWRGRGDVSQLFHAWPQEAVPPDSFDRGAVPPDSFDRGAVPPGSFAKDAVTTASSAKDAAHDVIQDTGLDAGGQE